MGPARAVSASAGAASPRACPHVASIDTGQWTCAITENDQAQQPNAHDEILQHLSTRFAGTLVVLSNLRVQHSEQPAWPTAEAVGAVTTSELTADNAGLAKWALQSESTAGGRPQQRHNRAIAKRPQGMNNPAGHA